MDIKNKATTNHQYLFHKEMILNMGSRTDVLLTSANDSFKIIAKKAGFFRYSDTLLYRLL